MTYFDQTEATSKNLSRRTVVKAAAWSAPAIVAATAVPRAAASEGPADAAFTTSRLSLGTLEVFSGGTINAAGTLLPSFPAAIGVHSNSENLQGPLTGIIEVTYGSGLPVALPSLTGNATFRGFGVTDIPGATLGARTITRRVLGSVNLGLITVSWGVNETSQPFTLHTGSMPPGTEQFLTPLGYGVTAKQGILSADALVTYNVRVVIYNAGNVVGETFDVITVPLGAGIL